MTRENVMSISTAAKLLDGFEAVSRLEVLVRPLDIFSVLRRGYERVGHHDLAVDENQISLHRHRVVLDHSPIDECPGVDGEGRRVFGDGGQVGLGAGSID